MPALSGARVKLLKGGQEVGWTTAISVSTDHEVFLVDVMGNIDVEEIEPVGRKHRFTASHVAMKNVSYETIGLKAKAGTVTALGLLALTYAPADVARASSAVAREEGLECTSCHRRRGGRKLNDQGKYFELMRSVEGYEQLEERFGRCTTCHVRKPGSKKLTKEGGRYRWMMQDMEGIRSWLMSRHPKPPVMDPPVEAGEPSERHGD